MSTEDERARSLQNVHTRLAYLQTITTTRQAQRKRFPNLAAVRAERDRMEDFIAKFGEDDS